MNELLHFTISKRNHIESNFEYLLNGRDMMKDDFVEILIALFWENNKLRMACEELWETSTYHRITIDKIITSTLKTRCLPLTFS